MRIVRVMTSWCSFLALVFVCAGCWTRARLAGPAPLNPGDKVWIWDGDKGVQWHDVIITDDSVTGVLSNSPRNCDTCRRSLPRAQVDSIIVIRPSIIHTLFLYAASAGLLYVIVVLPKSH